MSEQAGSLTERLEGPEIEFFLVADSAEAVNGKLYMLGGGWERRGVMDFNQPQPLALVLGVLIPWNDTNRPIPLALSLRDEDGNPLALQFQTELRAGRPPHARLGQQQRFMLALNAHVVLPKPGEYVVEAQLDHRQTKRVSFFLDQAAGLPGPGLPRP